MIIKGKSRSAPKKLGPYLANAEKNERAKVLEIKGTFATDIVGALEEMDAYAVSTKCEKPLYHAIISPEPPHRLSDKQRNAAVDLLEKKLGLDGHARVVVLHEHAGREHFHVVWTRIDMEKMRAVSMSHNYRKHEEVSRELERLFGHERVQGAHHERDGIKRPDRTPSRSDLRQQERTGISGKKVKAEVTYLYRSSDGAEAFRNALEDQGYILAQGDRRDFVIVDKRGGVHSLARRIEGIRAADLRDYMKPIDRTSLPNAEQARQLAEDRIKQTQALDASRGFAKGEDYVTQSNAALEYHKDRQKALDKDRREKIENAFRNTGAPLTEDQTKRLENWLKSVEQGHKRSDRQDEVSGQGRNRDR